MRERLGRLDDAQLERGLIDVGAHLAYPATPDLAGAVRARLAAPGPPPGRPRWWAPLLARRGVAFAALALLLIAVATLAVSPETRDALAGRLGLRGVDIVHLPSLPVPTPAAAPASGSARELGASLGLGERVADLADAAARVPFPVRAPTAPELGAPDEVYVGSLEAGQQVALLYRERPGLARAAETEVALLLLEFRGTVEVPLLRKGLGPDTRLEEVVVNGGMGVWIEGKPHVLFYRAGGQRAYEERIRLAGNVLVWEQDRVTLRIEGALSKEQALRIAATVR
jgi:hypothetical protein